VTNSKSGLNSSGSGIKSSQSCGQGETPSSASGIASSAKVANFKMMFESAQTIIPKKENEIKPVGKLKTRFHEQEQQQNQNS